MKLYQCFRNAWSRQCVDITGRLSKGITLFGSRFSVGYDEYQNPRNWRWAVRGEFGDVLFIARDAFDAGRVWHDLETNAIPVPLVTSFIDFDALEPGDAESSRFYFAILDLWRADLRAGREPRSKMDYVRMVWARESAKSNEQRGAVW
jgi:hypothetical protein